MSLQVGTWHTSTRGVKLRQNKGREDPSEYTLLYFFSSLSKHTRASTLHALSAPLIIIITVAYGTVLMKCVAC